MACAPTDYDIGLGNIENTTVMVLTCRAVAAIWRIPEPVFIYCRFNRCRCYFRRHQVHVFFDDLYLNCVERCSASWRRITQSNHEARSRRPLAVGLLFIGLPLVSERKHDLRKLCNRSLHVLMQDRRSTGLTPGAYVLLPVIDQDLRG